MVAFQVGGNFILFQDTGVQLGIVTGQVTRTG
jgi:hypothetical protein